ncbi:amidohydrolase [Chloroflexus sp.]|uniref:amidohydrolase n=1 Tax=Chloroflexus sp. TaxID=1904827 RepID=UPI002627215B|nr:amidohydrolase [uncultured Chloroflexus sp.]
MTTMVLYNGPIYTLNPAQPVAQALAIRNEQVLAVGDEDSVRAVAGPQIEPIDLQGRAVVPGLTDAHVHVVLYGLARQEVRLTGCPDLATALEQIAATSRRLPPDAWLRGNGWDHTLWGGRWPTRADLDRVCPDRPAVLWRKDGHSLWVNSRALALAGITAATPDPDGGQIQRDEHGEPTGILLEAAMELARTIVPPPTRAERLAALELAIDEALSYGLTGLHVPPSTDPSDGSDTLIDLQGARAAGKLKLRVLMHIAGAQLDHAIALGLRSGLGDDWLRIGGLKLFADGSLGSESAHMLAPYEGRNHTGIAVIPPAEVKAIVARANAHGISVAVHAIGDAANRSVLDAISAARLTAARLAFPNRIEHAQILDPRDIPRFAELGVIASMQPIHCIADMAMAERLWGARCATSYAWRSLLNAGATLAFGSDAPVETLDPWAGIHAAVTRQTTDGKPEGGWYPEQQLTVAEALAAYCVGPALAEAAAERKGRLIPGMLADLVVLNGDPFQVPATALHTLRADLTIVGGRVMFERSSQV